MKSFRLNQILALVCWLALAMALWVKYLRGPKAMWLEYDHYRPTESLVLILAAGALSLFGRWIVGTIIGLAGVALAIHNRWF